MECEACFTSAVRLAPHANLLPARQASHSAFHWQSFEAATFAQGFYPQTSHNGVVELHTHNPQNGAQSLFIGQRIAGYASASLILAVDLAGQTDVSLDYWVRDNGADEELRLSISDDDGANWTEIRNLDDIGQSFTHDLIDLDNITSQNGLTLNDQFRIRFSYYGSYGDVNDGMVIDDLRVSGSSSSSSFTVYMPLLQR